MDAKDNSQITAFDTLFSNNHIQMLKILLPYMDNQFQKYLAIYIKFQELQVALSFFHSRPFPLCGCMPKQQENDPAQIVKRLLPLCNKEEKEHLTQILNTLQSMSQYQEMMKTMEMMKAMMPPPDSNTGASSSSESSLTDVLMGMLTPEQKQMFEMFSAMGELST